MQHLSDAFHRSTGSVRNIRYVTGQSTHAIAICGTSASVHLWTLFRVVGDSWYIHAICLTFTCIPLMSTAIRRTVRSSTSTSTGKAGCSRELAKYCQLLRGNIVRHQAAR